MKVAIINVSVGQDSVDGIVTPYWLVSLVEAKFSAPIQTGPGALPASCTMVTGCFLGVKQLGCGVDHSPPSSAEVEG